MNKWTIRKRDSVHTTMVEDGVSVESWPLAIDAPSPPFVLGRVIALIARDISLAETEANARMIALAPDLLNVLNTIIYQYDRGFYGRPLAEAIAQARIIVAEVKGEEGGESLC